MSDPATDVEARLRQIREDIDAILDGEEARKVDGHTAGTLDDITGVVFGLYGRETDVRATQEPVDEPPAPAFGILGYYLDALAAASGYPPMQVARHAIQAMERAKDRDDYDRSATVVTEEEGGQ